DKNGQITYRRDQDDGTFILDEDDEVIVDSDFPKALHDIRSSQAAEDHPWLTGNVDSADIGAEGAGWSVSVSTVLHDDRYLTLDPKRLSRKRADVVSYISGGRHFALGDVIDFLPDRTGRDGRPTAVDSGTRYKYVEIQDVQEGAFRWTVRSAWELTSR